VSVEEIWRLYDEGADHASARFFEDTSIVIPQLAKWGFRLYLITAQRKHLVEAQLEQEELLPHFRRVVSLVDDKAAAITTICEEEGISPKDFYYVGDFCSDMDHARRAGVNGIGITRGHDTSKVLFAEGASVCIENLSELLTLFSDDPAVYTRT
jgi:phosphoglycolate phosphatase-like HAD superfamily hydrolase